MDKIFLSVRLTENFFSKAELKRVKSILKTYNNKSEFLRDIIKLHLTADEQINVKKTNIEISNKEFIEVKKLITKNNSLLKELSSNKIKVKNLSNNNSKNDKVFNKEEQIKKTEKILNLVEEF